MAINYNEDIVYNIDVDFYSKTQMNSVYTKQYDENTRYIVATVWKDGEVYVIPSGFTASFVATRPDMQGVEHDCTIESGKIVYKIQSPVTTKSGSFPAEFRLYKSITETDGSITNKHLASPSFTMYVDKSALLESTMIASPQYSTLDKMTNTIQTLFDESEQTISNINTAVTNTTAAMNAANTSATNANNAAVEASGIANAMYNDNQTWSANEAARQTNTATAIANANTATANAEAKIVDVETRFTNLSTAQQQDAEVILARNGEPSLGARLDSIGKITKFTYTATASGTTTLTHNLAYDSTKDDLIAIYKGIMLEEGINYTGSINSIALIGWSINAGDIVNFKCYKNVK